MTKNTKRSYKKLLAIPIVFILLIALAFVGYNFLLSPINDDSQEINFVVDTNDNLSTITNKLEKEAIIKSAVASKIYGKVSNVSNFVEGAFTLDKSWSSKEILQYLTQSINVISNEVTVTLQEGLWAKEMAEKIALNIDVNKEELLDLWNDEVYIKSIMKDYPFLTEDVLNDVLKVKLEGYLAPNTYNFYIDTDIKTITKKLLDQTLIIYNKYVEKFNASDYTIHELFTLASLTQYEAGNFEDDQIIAGIWYNRLALNMRLESSVTVCYGLYEFESFEDCEKNTDLDSPYNTYKNEGVTPGPVTNPGENSIRATLEPKDTDYLFFLADVYNDGKIYYSETFAEHAEKVNKYLR